jgi:hypothetical protein
MNLQGTLYTIFGILLWIPVLPLLLIAFLPFLVIRLCVHLLASILRPDLIPITSPTDNMLITGPSRSFHVNNSTQIWKLKGKLDIRKFREYFHNVFLSSPELREKYRNLYCYYVQWGMYCFKKAVVEIDLEDRIKECELVVGGDRELEQFIGNFSDSNDFG